MDGIKATKAKYRKYHSLEAYYYFAIIEDFILRFTWSLSVSIGQGLLFHNELLTTLLSCLEVFRKDTRLWIEGDEEKEPLMKNKVKGL